MADKLITEEAYIAYFTGLASKHKAIKHGIDNRKSFFYIPVEMDLVEIDNALRDNKAVPLLALDALRGGFDSNQSARYLQTVNGQFFVLDKVEKGKQEDIRRAQDVCLKIGLEILARMVIDLKTGTDMVQGARFTMDDVKFDPVGPMAMSHYGYTFRYAITCPLSFSVDSGTWTDK